jgi:hypothetical protein
MRSNYPVRKALSWISGIDVGSLAASLLINADAVKDRILITRGWSA